MRRISTRLQLIPSKANDLSNNIFNGGLKIAINVAASVANKRSVSLLRLMIVASFVFSTTPFAADGDSIVWQAYDESAVLQSLADHPNSQMQFKLLQSKIQNKNDLWAPFTDDLAAFSENDYQRLKPLILEQSVPDIQQAVVAGQISYAALTTFYIYRIREIETNSNLSLNAVIALNPDAIKRAKRLDQLHDAGNEISLNSVFGIPVLLKDNIGFEGLATTAGSLSLQSNHTASAFLTEKLEANGAIILGKANMSEWAYFFCNDCPSGYSAMGGQTLNPYGRFLFGTGGSSSGSGAAGAANMASLTIGSETSGSILSPASANSMVGYKPTTGLVSRSGVVPISSTLDTTGPITKSVADALILFNAMTGFDQQDLAMPLLSDDFRLINRQIDLAEVRIGVMSNFTDDAFYSKAVELLKTNGAQPINIDFQPTRSPRFSELLGGEMVRDLQIYLSANADPEVNISSITELQQYNLEDMNLRAPYGQGLVDMMVKLELSPRELEIIREELQASARSQLETVFNENGIDVLLSVNNRSAGIAALANYPALTIPMGYEENGRPIGLTLIVPSFEDQILFDIGVQFELLTEARRLPELYQ
jgi:amidase